MSSNFKNEEFIQRIESEIEKFLHRVLLKIHADAVGIIDSNRAVAWGEMRRNVRYEVYKEVGQIFGVLGVGANVPYAIFRHEGTRPHWPPLLPLYQWVVKKGFVKLNNKPTTLGRLRTAKKSESERALNEIKNIAFLVARKISRSGTQGLAFLRMALNQNLSFIADELNRLKIS